MPRINTRRAAVVGLASWAALTLVPLLGQAKPTERVVLLLAAIPAAAALGYLAGYAAGPLPTVLPHQPAPPAPAAWAPADTPATTSSSHGLLGTTAPPREPAESRHATPASTAPASTAPVDGAPVGPLPGAADVSVLEVRSTAS